jgi:glycosyltransferase involved in cell wall biosynthesis
MRRRLLPLLPRPAAIICASRYLAALAGNAAQFRTVPVHRVPQGLPFLGLAETQLPRDVARRTLGLPLDAPLVLLSAAHLDDWFKGTRLALDVARALRTPAARLVVLGAASPALRAAMPPTAIHLGYLTDDVALARVYRAADVLLMSSLGENLPYVALESLACETPVAAFRVGGLGEIVGDGERGLLAPPFDTAALAQAVDALLADPARRTACGAAGRRWVTATCDVPRWVEAHLAIYRRATAAFAGRRARGEAPARASP